MKYLLDTNICIYLITQKSQDILHQLNKHKPTDIGLPSIVAFELYYGVYNSNNQQQNLEALEAFLSPFTIIPYEYLDAIASGKIRAQLKKTGQIIGPYDLQIAGQALQRELTLITNNEKEFARVQGLQIENWA